MTFSPDGRLLASLTGESSWVRGELKVRDVEEGRELLSLRQPVRCVAFHPDGKTIATSGKDGVALWDIATGRSLRTMDESANPNTFSVAFSSDGETLAGGTPQGKVWLWDVASGRLRGEIDHGTGFYSAVFLPDNHTLITAGISTPVKVWDTRVAAGAYPVMELPGGYLLALSQDGRTLASGDFRTPIRLWDLPSGTLQNVTTGSPLAGALALTPHGRLLVAQGFRGDIRVIDWTNGPKPVAIINARRPPDWIELSPGGRILAAAGPDATVRIWDATTGEQRAVFGAPWLFRGACAAALLGFVVWCVAWVRAGVVRQPPARPFWDLVFIAAIISAVLLLRVGTTGDRYEFGRPALLFLAAVLGSLFCLLIAWCILGSMRWSLRVPGLVAGIALLGTVPINLWRGPSWQVWQVIVGGGVLVASVLILLKICHLLGVRVVRIGPDGSVVETNAVGRSSQYLLLDMVLWSVAAATLFAVARAIQPVGMPFGVYEFLTVTCVSIAMASVVAMWGALGLSHWSIRLLVGIGIAAACGSIRELFFPKMVMDVPWWWYASLAPLIAGFTAAALFIYRAHGYRIGGVALRRGGGDGPH